MSPVRIWFGASGELDSEERLNQEQIHQLANQSLGGRQSPTKMHSMPFSDVIMDMN